MKDLNQTGRTLFQSEMNVLLVQLLEILPTTKVRITLQTIVVTQQTILEATAVSGDPLGDTLTLRKLS